jgi:hypothetical protein
LPSPDKYKVKKGDTLAGIAKQFHHAKWQTIWNAPENKSLVSKRKKPEAIEPGDQLTIPLNEKQQAAATEKESGKSKEKYRTLTLKGREIVVSEAEFEAISKDMLSVLKKAVLAAELRAVAARSCWDSFNELNKDQKIVSWFVNSFGVKMPPESVVKAAEQAHEKLKSAVASGDFKKIEVAMADGVKPINTAYKTMMDYRESVIGRAGTQIAMLEFTRDTCFDIVTGIATAELGGTPQSGAAAGAASGMIKSAAGELGKYIAGTGGGAAAATKTVVLDGVLGAASGAVGPFMKLHGDKVAEHVAEVGAKWVGGKWAARLGSKRVETFLARRLEGAGKSLLDSAVKNVCKTMKSDVTPLEFAKEVGKDMGLGAALNGLDPWMEEEFAPAVCNKLVAAGLKFTGKASKKDVIKIIADLINDKKKDAVGKSLELVMEKAKGDESAEALGSDAATEFAKSNMDYLEQEILNRITTK